jgi:hypothetical protein
VRFDERYKLKNAVVWDVTPCIVLGIYRRFGKTTALLIPENNVTSPEIIIPYSHRRENVNSQAMEIIKSLTYFIACWPLIFSAYPTPT